MNARADDFLGLYFDMPNAVYHASPGLSCSGMHALARSPWHHHQLYRNPKRPPRREKPGQLEGTLMHCALFEPDEFDSRYCTGPNINRNTKDWKNFVASADGGGFLSCIQADQRAVAFAQADALRALPDVAQLLSAGHPEVAAFAVDPQTGVLLRCRPDWVHPVGERQVILFDGKTYSDAAPREFARQIARKGYHRQAAHYSRVYELAAGVEVVGFVFGAVETEWPHAACAVMLDDESLERGRTECRRLIDLYAECVRTDHWPGYPGTVQPVFLPAWAFATTETIE